MEDKNLTEAFIRFGLTRQEAIVYHRLLTDGRQTGYEISKATGISRSNTYSALSSLTEKGAAYVVEETAKKYTPVPIEEFCDNRIRLLSEEKEHLISGITEKKNFEDGYITIEGSGNILNKVRNLLAQAEERAYISCSFPTLQLLKSNIESLIENKKQIVIITDGPFELEGATVYSTSPKGNQIGIITDSKYVLTGEYGSTSMNTCLYSGQKNFVLLFKTAMSNEIKLIRYTKGE